MFEGVKFGNRTTDWVIVNMKCMIENGTPCVAYVGECSFSVVFSDTFELDLHWLCGTLPENHQHPSFSVK